MCISYETTSSEELHDLFDAPITLDEAWPLELYRDYNGPIIVHNDAGRRKSLVGGYSMVPKRHLPRDVEFSTMNARDDKLGIAKNYKPYWTKGQLCLVPMHHFFEPNWEGPEHVRWKIGMADWTAFAVAGLYREWSEPDGRKSIAFTQITVNADDHPLMKRFHRPGEEKRSLVIVHPNDYDDWLACRDPEVARSFLQLYPAEQMAAVPAPKPKSSKSKSPKTEPL